MVKDTLYLCGKCKKEWYLSETQKPRKCPNCGVEITKDNLRGWRYYSKREGK